MTRNWIKNKISILNVLVFESLKSQMSLIQLEVCCEVCSTADWPLSWTSYGADRVLSGGAAVLWRAASSWSCCLLSLTWRSELPPSNWTTRVVFCHFPWTRFCLRVLLTLRGSGLCVSFQDAQPAVFLNLTAQSKNNSLSFLKLSLYNMMLLSNELMLFFLVKASTWVSYLNLWLHGVCRITVLCFYIQNRACDGQMEAQQGIHNLSWCLGWCFSASNIYEHKKCSLKK